MRDALASESLAGAGRRHPAGDGGEPRVRRRRAVLDAGDELALIPPVSGGSTAAAPWVRVSAEPLSLDALAERVRDPRAGAVVTFSGVTREVERLEYEAYAEMAEERMAAIAAEALETHGLCAAAVEHRVGDVPLSEPSVIVAVSAPHRGEAFAGAREIIDRVKAEAPIWKKEIEGGEERWVRGAPAPPRVSDAGERAEQEVAQLGALDMSRCSSQSRIAPSMNHSHARTAARSFGGGGPAASRPRGCAAEVASRISSISALTSGHAARALHQLAVGASRSPRSSRGTRRGCAASASSGGRSGSGFGAPRDLLGGLLRAWPTKKSCLLGK